MPNEYETEFWRVRLPAGWVAREGSRKGDVTIQKAGGIGVFLVLTTDQEPTAWSSAWSDDDTKFFHGQLYGRTFETKVRMLDAFNEFQDLTTRLWCLWCGNVTVYMYYCCRATGCELEREEVNEIVLSLVPNSFGRPLQALFGS